QLRELRRGDSPARPVPVGDPGTGGERRGLNDAGPFILYIDDDEGLRRLFERALTRRGFRVRLAASGAEGVELARANSYDLIAIGPFTLSLDDDEGPRRRFERALPRRGFRVRLAASGAEGVELARANSYDLIAIDHYKPGQDGLATLKALQALESCPPVVYVT